MSEFASRAYRQVQLPTTERRGRTRRHRRRGLFVAVLAAVILGVTLSTDLPVWHGASVGGLSSAIAGLSTDSDVAGNAVPGGTVPVALGAVRAEKEQVEAERTAFAAFAEETASLPTAKPSAMSTNAQTVNAAPAGSSLDDVRETYRETVMSTEDFDLEYGETFGEHVAAEFGDDVAALLVDGHRLNKPLKRLLVEQAKQAARKRGLLLEGLAVEERSLEEAATTLEQVQDALGALDGAALDERSLFALADLDAELQAHRESCLDLLRTRQEEIHTVNRRLNGESKTLTQVYLYRDLPMSFPVLSTTLDCLAAIADARSAVTAAACRTR